MNHPLESSRPVDNKFEMQRGLSSQVVSDQNYLNFRGMKTSDPSLTINGDGTMSFGSPFEQSSSSGRFSNDQSGARSWDGGQFRETDRGGDKDRRGIGKADHHGGNATAGPDSVVINGSNDNVTIYGDPRSITINGSNDTVAINHGYGKPYDGGTQPIPGDGGANQIPKAGDGQPITSPNNGDGQTNPLQNIQQEMQSIMTALEQAIQQSGGDPNQFWQDFMNDLNKLIGSNDTPPTAPPPEMPPPIECPGGGGGAGTGAGQGSTGDGSAGGQGNGGSTGNGSNGLDMSKIFTAGDSGVTSAELQHEVALANALPDDIKQTLLSGGAQITLNSGWNGGPQGVNDGTSGQVYVDSGMADQATIHELYEMAGQISPSTLAGSWNDPKTVQMADSALSGNLQGGNPGDLNDTVGNVQGDGDLMSNIFTADFFAKNPGLYQDSTGQGILQASVADAPSLTSYIAQEQGLGDAGMIA